MSEPQPIRIRVLISGTVQGVGFRSMTEKMASRIGVQGWVRNRADGRVEAVFQGSEAKVESILRWCRHGSPPAQVEAVEVIPERVEPLSGFAILPTLR